MPDSVWAIVVAGGDGRRFGGPKQFTELIGRPVFEWSLDACRSITEDVVLVVPAAMVEDEHVQRCCRNVVAGGQTRSASVRAGLAAVPKSADVIVVHDAARPAATAELFAAVVATVLGGADGAIPGIAISDTVKRVKDGLVVETLDRSALVSVQTPQAFRAEVLRKAHATEQDATDDAALIESLGGRVVIVEGESNNTKLTVESDLVAFAEILGSDRSAANT